jgi:hypothetical protein
LFFGFSSFRPLLLLETLQLLHLFQIFRQESTSALSQKLLLLLETKKASKGLLSLGCDFVLSLDQTIPGLIRWHRGFTRMARRDTRIALENIVVAVTGLAGISATLTQGDVCDTEGLKEFATFVFADGRGS